MSVQIWDNFQLQEYLLSKDWKVVRHEGRRASFEGFNFFGPGFIYLRADTEDRSEGRLFREAKDYPEDRHVVSLDDSFISGIFSFLFCRQNYDFDHYAVQILETRQDKRNTRVATSLIKRLNEPCFLYGQILMIKSEDYLDDGKLYLRHVIEREFNGKNFRVVDGSCAKLADY